MAANHIIGNRNSTPETSSSNLRPPSSRSTLGASHHLRSSADWSRGVRPSSEVYYNQNQSGQNQGNPEDSMDKAAQQWIADIEQYETTLEEMAAATLDQDFKDELHAIEQWFRVLSEAERTAALYSLLQQTTQVQIRFFIGVLQQMAKSHPMSGVLSPASFGEKDPMSNRLSSAMSKLSTDGNRSSLGPGRTPATPSAKRHSGLDQDEINSRFPEAAAAIAKQKADFTQHTGTAPTSNRNSAAVGERSSLVAPTISAPHDDLKKEPMPAAAPSPWGKSNSDNQSSRPKSSSGQQPMGQFAQPPPSAGLRSPRPTNMGGEPTLQNTTLNGPDPSTTGLPLLSPYQGGSWASMTTTPMFANFPSQQQSTNHADQVANATAMKLAAMSTVNNRIQLDDVRKYRRSRSTEGQKAGNAQPMSPGFTGTTLPANFVMTNELGQVLSPQQAAALQAQQLAAISGQRRSRPSSPAAPGGVPGNMGMGPPQNQGFLSAYDTNPNLLNTGMPSLTVGQYGMGMGMEDPIDRGRSPRGRRATSKPPEDPTDVELLQDIPGWLRSLRLHKYTDNLKDLKWTDLVQLDDEGLEKRGVNALGARRKMLKVFEQVREAQAGGKI